MTGPPDNPKIYHITHIDNLRGIVQHGCLWSDARCDAEDITNTTVGISDIKQRRIKELDVKCHPGSKVGDYVPFYFCSRSIMLYLLYRGNHPDLTCRGGQQPIVHLQADMKAAIEWAETNGRPWAFSDRNAGGYLANFFNTLHDLDKINWQAVETTNFRHRLINDGKQAEFLAYESFPWELVEKIGVIDARIKTQVERILEVAEHKPIVSVERTWYY